MIYERKGPLIPPGYHSEYTFDCRRALDHAGEKNFVNAFRNTTADEIQSRLMGRVTKASYGHATRVSAFTCHLLSLPLERRPSVHIVSSAPKRVFSDSIALGAQYRYAEIDPVIVQPLAYRVDRKKSVQKDVLLEIEVLWLKSINAVCVLSDAAFLGCSAAKTAGIPSALVTNFTFDSVYSYLATTFVDQSPTLHSSHPIDSLLPEYLSRHIHAGYRCADLLLLLPGNIPIPSFPMDPLLPASRWVDTLSNRLLPEIMSQLGCDESVRLYPSIPFPSTSALSQKLVRRMIKRAPLLVRPPTTAYLPQGRSDLLNSIGVPPKLHDATTTKILIVSFGGQVFRTPMPSRSNSRTHSRNISSDNCFPGLGIVATETLPVNNSTLSRDSTLRDQLKGLEIEDSQGFYKIKSPRIATTSHIWIPGAPPAHKPPMTPKTDREEVEARLLPDASWIAIVCGVTKEQWQLQGDPDSELPEGFYLAPKDVYMPDLTAVADVLLGKLGYGTVSECVDAHTPFVYVSRPLFVEEHGLRLLLDNEGVGVELPRASYEAGDWAEAVQEAWELGRDAKAKHRKAGGSNKRQEQGRQMASSFVDWVEECWRI
ncbi:hypothetical protein CPB85DRAFT_1374290 [Mucidula mucida]|nr:hypothetical protein CPB85DRAFT_1374290 [Mucidula mucida]